MSKKWGPASYDTHLEAAQAEIITELENKIDQLQQWVNDLHAGMYINCVYCGHRYGPDTEVPPSMAEVLKEHIEQCPEHPLSHAKETIEWLQQYRDLWERYQSNKKTVTKSGFFDNYTDAMRARTRMINIEKQAYVLLKEEKRHE